MSLAVVQRPRGSVGARTIVIGAALAFALSACSSQGATTPAPTSAPAAAPTSAPAGSTITLREIGGKQVVVAGSNQMTVYTFTKDTPGVSNCIEKCVTNWPPLVVTGGQAPTASSGLSGKLGTIARADGAVQVTYNDLPLYFYAKDTAPGDLTGVYTNWELVKP